MWTFKHLINFQYNGLVSEKLHITAVIYERPSPLLRTYIHLVSLVWCVWKDYVIKKLFHRDAGSCR